MQQEDEPIAPFGSRSKTDVILISVANGGESDDFRADVEAIYDDVIRELELPSEELYKSIHLGGHGAAWEAYALFSTAMTVYGAYKMAKDGLEVAEDVKKVYIFTKRLPTLIREVSDRASQAFQARFGGEPRSLVSVPEEVATLVALNRAIESCNPDKIHIESCTSYPDCNDPIFKGKAHTYDFIYEIRINVDDCIQIVFVHHSGDILGNVHLAPWHCVHGGADESPPRFRIE